MGSWLGCSYLTVIGKVYMYYLGSTHSECP